MDPPKIRTPFKPIMIWRPKTGLQYCQTWQDGSISLADSGEDFYTTLDGVSGRRGNEAQKQRGSIWRDFDYFFFFLQSALCFYTLEGNFHQVSLTSILKQIKSQQKNPTLGQVLAWEWWVHQPLTGLASWGHAWWGPCIRAFSCPIQIQILLLWRKSLIQITPGLQMPLCLGLPSSGLLWSRGLAECKNKD